MFFFDEQNEVIWFVVAALAATGLFLGAAIIGRHLALRRGGAASHILFVRNNNFNWAAFSKNRIKPKKFTLEENAAALDLIEKKSSEAFAFGATIIAHKHLEVFNLCQKYLDLVASELKTIRPGSPRLLALKKGRNQIESLHKQHLLIWAAAESHNLTKEVAVKFELREKIEPAQRALDVLRSALLIYPTETKIIDSISLVEEFIVSTRVAHWVEEAERAVFKKQFRRAIDHYQDALFYLERASGDGKFDGQIIGERLNDEIKRLRKFVKQKKRAKN